MCYVEDVELLKDDVNVYVAVIGRSERAEEFVARLLFWIPVDSNIKK